MALTEQRASSSDDALRELEAEPCRSLSDATSLRILYALEDGPLSVGELRRRLSVRPPTAPS